MIGGRERDMDMVWRSLLSILLVVLLGSCALLDRKPSVPGELSLVKETEHALFYVRDTDEDIKEMVDILSAEFERQYARITELLRFVPPEKTVVFIYTDKSQFQERIGRATEGTYDAGERRIKVYTPANLSRNDMRKAYTDQLVHEFVHAVIFQINPNIGQVKWLDEGTAYYVSNQLQDELQYGRRARVAIPGLDKFVESDRYFEEAGGEAYYFSGLIVKYLHEEFGEDLFNDVLRDPESLETILGMPLVELHKDWSAYVTELHEGLLQ